MIFLLALSDSESDAAMLSELFDENYPRLKRTAAALLHDESAAEDAVQDAFIACMRRIDTVRGLSPDARRFYLLTAVRRNALNTLREQKRYVWRMPDGEEPKTASSAEEQALHALTVQQVREAFAVLPESLKDVLRYKYLMGMTDREIAALLGVRKASVRVYLMRARQAVLKQCEENEHEKA
jgi:RNA polymerase sigma-70 factor (ECF subfamily)